MSRPIQGSFLERTIDNLPKVRITDEMVEAGAQALRRAFLAIEPRKDWRDIPEASRHRYRIEARACLVAAFRAGARAAV